MVLESLAHPLNLPEKSVAELAIAPIIVVAPHPDDETLGCGGAIALLRHLNCPVSLLVVSDGTKSHPNSLKYPAPVLQALRASETVEAMGILGVEEGNIFFLNLPDGAVPFPDSDSWQQGLDKFQKAIASIIGDAKRGELEKSKVKSRTGATPCARTKVREEKGGESSSIDATSNLTVFLPWRSDPHPDHRATWHLVRAALTSLQLSPRIVEYPIWDWDKQQQGKFSNSTPMNAWRIDIESVLEKKRKAIASYRSQTTNLIDDDPSGFQLSPEMLDNFLHPWEIYFEEIPI